MEGVNRAGRMLSHYRIEATLGVGGMGTVYRAVDERLQRAVALKVLSSELFSDHDHRRRLEKEARSASAISHGNVAHIYDFGESDGEYFIAMEYVEGETLESVLQRRTLCLGEVLRIAVQIVDALDAAHARGIIHRDIKPSNVMVTARGDVKVLDFGIARVSSESVQEAPTQTATVPGTVLGTVPYMSPEQAMGRSIDHRSDIFSFGTLLYELLTHARPFRGANALETLMCIVQADPEPVVSVAATVPPELGAVVHRCLEKDPEKRFQSTTELLRCLRRTCTLHEAEHASVPDALSTPSCHGTAERHVSLTLEPASRRYETRAVVALGACGVLAAAVLGGWWFVARGPAYDSVAVLPFTYAENNPEVEYVSDSLTESLINGLSRVKGVRVVSRNSVFSLKGKQVDRRALAGRLGVKALLTGGVSVNGGTIEVTARLVESGSDAQIWSRQYTRPTGGAFMLPDEITRDVSAILSERLSVGDGDEAVKRQTGSGEAYLLYLKGRYHWNKRTVDSLKLALDFFQQAIDQDPTYALAYAGLAESYMLLGNVVPPAEAFAKARAAANKALAVNANLPDPHATLGFIALHYDWNWPQAKASLIKASELNPNYATARSIYSRYLIAMGRYPESVEEMKHAQEMDPLALGIATGIGLCHYYAGHFDDAIAAYNKALEMNPRFVPALLDRGDAYIQKRMFKEAFESYDQALSITPKDAGGIAQRAHGYAVAGRRTDAQAALSQLEAFGGERYVSPYFFAMIYAGLGDTNSALAQLELGFTHRTSPLIYVNVDPVFSGMRQQPRFRSLVERMRLTDPS